VLVVLRRSPLKPSGTLNTPSPSVPVVPPSSAITSAPLGACHRSLSRVVARCPPRVAGAERIITPTEGPEDQVAVEAATKQAGRVVRVRLGKETLVAAGLAPQPNQSMVLAEEGRVASAPTALEVSYTVVPEVRMAQTTTPTARPLGSVLVSGQVVAAAGRRSVVRAAVAVLVLADLVLRVTTLLQTRAAVEADRVTTVTVVLAVVVQL